MPTTKVTLDCSGVADDFIRSLLERGYNQILPGVRPRMHQFTAWMENGKTLIEFHSPKFSYFNEHLGPERPVNEPNYRRPPVDHRLDR